MQNGYEYNEVNKMGKQINSINKQLKRDGIIQIGNSSIIKYRKYYILSGYNTQRTFSNKKDAIKAIIKQEG